jgi:porphobilinogen deaminase
LRPPRGYDGCNTLKSLLENLVKQAVSALPQRFPDLELGTLGPAIERTRDITHGDFATNVAMQLAKAARRKPRDLAQAVVDALPASDLVARVEIAGPGFINFHLAPEAYRRELLSVLDDRDTERAVTAERVIVQTLGGDCHSPIGALAEINGEDMTLRVAIGSRGGEPPIIRASAACPCEHPDGAVGDVLKSLSEQNVQAILGQGR